MTMSLPIHHDAGSQQRSNGRTAFIAAAGAAAMLGLGFASVPLYRMFCEATGFGGTTQRADGQSAQSRAVAGSSVMVRFDANHSPALPWSFKPEVRSQSVTVGARNIAFFTATNLSDKPVTGTATFNVTPDRTGAYFTKIQCFCFNRQTLNPGQSVRMPVVYYVDPAMLKDDDAKSVEEITLSYTFYKVDEPGDAS
jgi:cytochrome c oxidase assembly protein subunit 11